MRPARRCLRRRVERRVEPCPAIRAGKQHRLAQRRSAGDRHGQDLALVEGDQRAARPFDIKILLRMGDRADHLGGAVQQHHSGQKRIAADIPDRSATPGRHITYIAIGLRRIGEGGRYMCALTDVQSTEPLPLRVIAHHVAVIDIQAGARRRRGQRVKLRHRQRHRFLADHRLAGLQRGDGHRHVKMVRQRVIDGIDIRVGQNILIGCDAHIAPDRVHPGGRVAPPHMRHLMPGRADCRQQLFAGDLGITQYSEPHRRLPPWLPLNRDEFRGR